VQERTAAYFFLPVSEHKYRTGGSAALLCKLFNLPLFNTKMLIFVHRAENEAVLNSQKQPFIHTHVREKPK